MSRTYNRYRHVTKAMQSASAARVVLADHTKCPKCGRWIPNKEIVNGVIPVHYLIGKIPCGWNDAS